MTFVEMVVVMAVLSILASVVMPMLRVSVKRAKETELRRDLREMRDAIDRYKKFVESGAISKEAGATGYPKTLETLTEAVDIANTLAVQPEPGEAQTQGQAQTQLPTKLRFLRKVPVDPMTGTAEWGLRSNEDDPDSTVWGGQDVFDVYSKSDGTALDGTNYSDW